jgi:hypothetical protein
MKSVIIVLGPSVQLVGLSATLELLVLLCYWIQLSICCCDWDLFKVGLIISSRCMIRHSKLPRHGGNNGMVGISMFGNNWIVLMELTAE